jgi:hypothetical protein
MLGAVYDEWDTLADTLHSLPVSLGELHDPKRIWSLGSDNPGELAELVTAHLSLSEEYLPHEQHLATISASLRELASLGTPNLGIVTGTVPSYEAFAASEGASPSDASLLPQYATTLAARGRAVAWPPQRGGGGVLVWVGAGLWGVPRKRRLTREGAAGRAITSDAGWVANPPHPAPSDDRDDVYSSLRSSSPSHRLR